MPKPADRTDREKRLAEALRRNLRRRTAKRAQPDAPEDSKAPG